MYIYIYISLKAKLIPVPHQMTFSTSMGRGKKVLKQKGVWEGDKQSVFLGISWQHVFWWSVYNIYVREYFLPVKLFFFLPFCLFFFFRDKHTNIKWLKSYFLKKKNFCCFNIYITRELYHRGLAPRCLLVHPCNSPLPTFLMMTIFILQFNTWG